MNIGETAATLNWKENQLDTEDIACHIPYGAVVHNYLISSIQDNYIDCSIVCRYLPKIATPPLHICDVINIRRIKKRCIQLLYLTVMMTIFVRAGFFHFVYTHCMACVCVYVWLIRGACTKHNLLSV